MLWKKNLHLRPMGRPHKLKKKKKKIIKFLIDFSQI